MSAQQNLKQAFTFERKQEGHDVHCVLKVNEKPYYIKKFPKKTGSADMDTLLQQDFWEAVELWQQYGPASLNPQGFYPEQLDLQDLTQ